MLPTSILEKTFVIDLKLAVDGLGSNEYLWGVSREALIPQNPFMKSLRLFRVACATHVISSSKHLKGIGPHIPSLVLHFVSIDDK